MGSTDVDKLVRRLLHAKSLVHREVSLLQNQNKYLVEKVGRLVDEMSLKDKEIAYLRNALREVENRPSLADSVGAITPDASARRKSVLPSGSSPPVGTDSSLPPPPPPPPEPEDQPQVDVQERQSIQEQIKRKFTTTIFGGGIPLSPRSASLQPTIEQRASNNFTHESYIQMVLTTGAEFTKYKNGSIKSRKKRWVWCDSKCERILWGALKFNRSKKQREVATKGSLLVENLIDVKRGISVKNRLGYARPDCCLLLVTLDRQLELEAGDRAMRDLWLDAFQTLMTNSGLRQLATDVNM